MIRITYIVTSIYGLPIIVFLGIGIIKIQTKYIVVSLGKATVVGVRVKELLDYCILVRNCRQYC